jgi:Na+/proline symporter
MSPTLILFIIVGYFLLLAAISYFTSKGADNDSFFVGNKQSPWYLVAFGMIGASLSGVTFISVPGGVSDGQFSYMQIVLGYFVGYMVISFVLMPLYYRMNLTSIYSYLEGRFGVASYKTGAFYFMISRIAGASIRLLLVAWIMQEFVFDAWNVPFAVTVLISILCIWLYTFRGGIKTIVWTDTLQTLFMLLAAGITVVVVGGEVANSSGGIWGAVQDSGLSKTFFFDDVKAANYFWKQFFAGALIAIAMTGLDQDMMQKNLSCRNIKDAQKNMISFSVVLVFVNLLFMVLGALLFVYANSKGIELPFTAESGDVVRDSAYVLGETKGMVPDNVYPTIALNGELGIGVGILFILGLVAAAYSSADSALTALTTSFCVDFLGIEKKEKKTQEKLRRTVHIGMSAVLFVVILIFHATLDKNAISLILTFGAMTYGPLIGLYGFGIFSKRKVIDRYVPIVCLLAPILSFILKTYSTEWFDGYAIGHEILAFNAAVTILGLFLISSRGTKELVGN